MTGNLCETVLEKMKKMKNGEVAGQDEMPLYHRKDEELNDILLQTQIGQKQNLCMAQDGIINTLNGKTLEKVEKDVRLNSKNHKHDTFKTLVYFQSSKIFVVLDK